ncbi:Interferon- developmental regulator 1 [Saguinus oedipus]|uniref:Interferon- developmental regulator 1 n=1 Tax=Saguinus oedipus TaxID=9490 RepID=A0ABQ9UWU9_SAGOE|nr:Interferon- developmental regulator 1 [Saguinus oedipus]
MPKNKKRNTPHGGCSGAAAVMAATAGGDEDASVETMSHCSGYSDPSSFAEDGPEVLDEEGTQEDLEYKLKGSIDLTLDKSAKTRQAALEGDITEPYSTLECLENIFTKSYLKEKDTTVICSTPNTVLHISSFLAWTLLLTICPINEGKKKLDMHFHKLPSLLSCDDVNMRIAAGESLALLFELARGIKSDFFYEDMESLMQMLRALATDGNKHQAKVDKGKQWSVFRERPEGSGGTGFSNRNR